VGVVPLPVRGLAEEGKPVSREQAGHVDHPVLLQARHLTTPRHDDTGSIIKQGKGQGVKVVAVLSSKQPNQTNEHSGRVGTRQNEHRAESRRELSNRARCAPSRCCPCAGHASCLSGHPPSPNPPLNLVFGNAKGLGGNQGQRVPRHGDARVLQPPVEAPRWRHLGRSHNNRGVRGGGRGRGGPTAATGRRRGRKEEREGHWWRCRQDNHLARHPREGSLL
jgi:hypothetical protein